jgi:hypothetical protein
MINIHIPITMKKIITDVEDVVGAETVVADVEGVVNARMDVADMVTGVVMVVE